MCHNYDFVSQLGLCISIMIKCHKQFSTCNVKQFVNSTETFGRPWCATKVDESGVMPNGTDNWGVCIDERATTYSFGPATGGDIEESGRFCSLPFKMGDW